MGSARRTRRIVAGAVIALTLIGGPSIAAAQQSPADDQYGHEVPAAGTPSQAAPGVFTPPSASDSDVASVSEGLPFTGLALVLPAVAGAVLLGAGVLVLYRTRRREDTAKR